jgi:hypothetical protein
MIKIAFSKYDFKIKKEEAGEMIFDGIRKRWVTLTTEECVRQNIISYLLIEKKYPAKLFAIEKEIRLGELKKRCDVVIYDKNMQPWMIIECKEMRVSLNVKVLEQTLRYHSSVPVPYLVITNGSYCFGFEKVGGEFVEISDFPLYKTI